MTVVESSSFSCIFISLFSPHFKFLPSWWVWDYHFKYISLISRWVDHDFCFYCSLYFPLLWITGCISCPYFFCVVCAFLFLFVRVIFNFLVKFLLFFAHIWCKYLLPTCWHPLEPRIFICQDFLGSCQEFYLYFKA